MNYTLPVSYAPITDPNSAYTIGVSEHIYSALQCSQFITRDYQIMSCMSQNIT